MSTVTIQTKVTLDDLIGAAEQLPNIELEKLARSLLQMNARRKAPNLPKREAELLQSIAQTAKYDRQSRYRHLQQEMERRSLSHDEQNELHELIGCSEAQTAKRLALLVELSLLRKVPLPALMKQLQIKAPEPA